MLFRRNKMPPDIINGLEKEKINTAWKLNLGFALIVIISIFAVGAVSFDMIVKSMINHAEVSSKELIKQTSKNLETILAGLDELAMTISRDSVVAGHVSIHDRMEDLHKKADNGRQIQEVLNNYTKTRTDIVDIAVITNKGDYINTGNSGAQIFQDVFMYYAIKKFKESNKQSIWLDTYMTDIGSTYTRSGNGQVFSIMKGIYTSSSLKSQGILLINIRESYLYNLIADIKSAGNGEIFIVGREGKYVLNPDNRSENSKPLSLPYIDDMLGKKNGGEIKMIDRELYLLTFNTIDEIKGTDLGWTIVEIVPVASIITSVNKAAKRLLIIGIGCIVVGFILTALITRLYNRFIDRSYSEKHSIAMERERLASLGQLIGGIAHNFKTPIMSISGGLEALTDLIDEYDNSIGDSEVTKEDHHEIAAEMKDWIQKIKPYCTYMSDVISAVKDQAVNLNESANVSFTVSELLRRVEVLMSHELKKYRCQMNIDLKVDGNTPIKGEINNLVQVMNNLISNSIESYNGEEGRIDVFLQKKGNNLEIVVRDYGAGIPENVKRKLLKEMITTKGKNGTGLGLYMSYSTIKGKFGGTMEVESEEGEGTSIHISIPCTTKVKGVGG
ncbi:MAG: sensor histidine kinase [Bacillota bacterium]